MCLPMEKRSFFCLKVCAKNIALKNRALEIGKDDDDDDDDDGGGGGGDDEAHGKSGKSQPC